MRAATVRVDAGAQTIRPPDPALRGTGLRFGRYASHEAVRWYLHFAFRDAHSVVDLSYGAGGCWRRPYPLST